MSNYSTFIGELLRLELGVTTHHVKDGTALYDYDLYQPNATLSNLGWFFCLKSYKDRGFRYCDKLADLQRLALSEIRLLEPVQQQRILVDAEDHAELLTALLKDAEEYAQAWDTHSGLQSQSFLESQILDRLIIFNRPQTDPSPKPHIRFVNDLLDIIRWKQGSLMKLIEKIQIGLMPVSISTKPLPKEKSEKHYDPPLILAADQEKLRKTLQLVIDKKQHDQMSSLLDGRAIEDKLWVKVKAASTVPDLFRRVLKSGNWSQVAYWLAKNFVSGLETPKPISRSSAYDVLQGKTEVSRQNQLPLF